VTIESGARLGPYELIDLIGAGGMGEIYLARDVRLGREVAIKLLPSGTGDATTSARFIREARAVSALNHPNVVTVFDVGHDAVADFIAMELVRGVQLRDIGPRPLAAVTIFDLGSQIARGLAAAHSRGIVHRDIKPENIVVRDDGLVKVLDFGVARVLATAGRSLDSEGMLTQAGLAVGTLRYMSPEQACAEEVGTESDVFSLGIILYELATGVHPFEGASEVAILASITSAPVLPPSATVSGIDRRFETLLLSMLSKKPSLRPTAADVAGSLTTIAANLSKATVSEAGLPTANIVGRERDRDLLMNALESAREGHGSILSISAEAGMGKTALAESFITQAWHSAQDILVGRGRCSERLAGAEPYLPWLEILDGLLSGDTSGLIARAMRAIAPGWYQQIDASNSPKAGQVISQAQSSERLVRELAAFFEDLARSHPIVLFLDDLHWADASTIDFLAFLAPRLTRSRILIVLTFRESELLISHSPFAALHTDLQSRLIARQLKLQYLTKTEIEAYISEEFPNHKFSLEFIEVIHRKTGGSPLFLVDVMRYLREENFLKKSEHRWVLTRDLRDVEAEVPASTRSMIQRKIDQLDDNGRRLLLVASVQGQEFDSAALADASGADPVDVEETLATLETVNVFVKRGAERILPDRTLSIRYRFAHVLYQNMLYATLTPSKRVGFSVKVAESLLAHYKERSSDIAAEVAVLFEAGNDPARAAANFAIAAQRSSQVFASRETEGYARRGLALCLQLPDSAEKSGLELGLQIQLGFSLRNQRGYVDVESGRCVTRARDICQRIGDIPALTQALWGVFAFYVVGGDLVSSLDVANQLTRIAEQSGRSTDWLLAFTAVGITRMHRGEIEPAHQLFERAIEKHNPTQSREYRSLFLADPGMFARAESIRTLWLMGRMQDATERAKETLAIAQRIDDPVGLAFTLVFMTFLFQAKKDVAETLSWANSCIGHCNEYGIAQEREWVRVARGWALALSGHTDEGLSQMNETISVQRATHSLLILPYHLGLLADALLENNRSSEAETALKEASNVMEATNQRFFEAELLRLLGRAQLRKAESRSRGEEEAALLFRAASGAALRAGAKLYAERAIKDLAMLERSHERAPTPGPIVMDS
jgi:serine/threonine protein kinase/predicted ATPase